MEYAAIPGDESVIAELSAAVITIPVTSIVSIASRPGGLAVVQASRHDPRRGAVRHPHAVAEQHDDVARPRRSPGSAAPVLHGQARSGGGAIRGARLDQQRAGRRDHVAAQQKVGGVTERGRRAIAGRQLRAGRTGAPGAALSVKTGLEQVLRRDLAAVDQHHQPARRIRGVSRVVFGLDPDVELLPHRQHAAVGGHDPDPRRAGRRHRDRQRERRPQRDMSIASWANDTAAFAVTLRSCPRCHAALMSTAPAALAAFGRTTTRRHDDNDETFVSHFDGLRPLRRRASRGAGVRIGTDHK